MSNLLKNNSYLGVLLTGLFRNSKVSNKSCQKYKFRTIDGRSISINYVSNSDKNKIMMGKEDSKVLQRYYDTEFKSDHMVIKSRID